MHPCHLWGKLFSRPYNLKRHINEIHTPSHDVATLGWITSTIPPYSGVARPPFSNGIVTPTLPQHDGVTYHQSGVTPATPQCGVTPPRGGVTPPHGGVTPPHGGVTPPNGGVTPPHGGVTPPNGGVTPPNGGVTPPPPPHGRVTLHGGVTPPPHGRVTPQPPPPHGGVTPPNGGVTPPHGGVTPPNGGVTPPNGGVTPPPPPHGRVTLHGGVTPPPHGRVTPQPPPPHGRVTPPPHGGFPPHVGVTPSHGGVTPPFHDGVTPPPPPHDVVNHSMFGMSVTRGSFVFQHPMTMNVCGPTCCGKTTWLKQLLLNVDKMIQTRSHNIFWFYKRLQPIYTELNKKLNNTKFIQCIPPAITNAKFFDDRFPSLFIFDDLMRDSTNK